MSGRVPNRATAQHDETIVYKDPPAANLFLGGGPLTIAERAQGVPTGLGLGAFQLRVMFNPKWVTLNISEGPFLASTGRDVACVTYLATGQVTFACVSTGASPGPSGAGILAYVTVAPVSGLQWRAVPQALVEVNVHDVASATVLADTLGTPFFLDHVSDSRLYVRALESDVVVNCAVDSADFAAELSRYGATIGSQLYSPFFDLEPVAAPDGDIDVLDVVAVSTRLGSTCLAPIPNQPPPPLLCSDQDGDGNCDKTDPDDDNDGMPDKVELASGCLNSLVADGELDPDGDGLTSSAEVSAGINPCLPDTDGDALGDGYEFGHSCLDPHVADAAGDADTDGLTNSGELNAATDPCAGDSDDDELLDGYEVHTAGTDPLDADTDDDGLPDGVEVNSLSTDPLDQDTDDDALPDGVEVNSTSTNPLDADTDDDTLLDGVEVSSAGTNPLDADSDDDGLSDGIEVTSTSTDPLDSDSDDDGLLDGPEVNSLATDPLDQDTDDDGLPDGDEVLVYATSALLDDTDSDTMSDPYEVARIPCGFNPIVSDGNMDADTDLLANLGEIGLGTDPCLPDSDGDSCMDGRETPTTPGSEMSGGRRNPLDPWDYFNPSHDGKNRVDDILLVVAHYFKDDNDTTPGLPPYAPFYSPDYDRTMVGPSGWNLGPPNGRQRVDDIIDQVMQYYHDCV